MVRLGLMLGFGCVRVVGLSEHTPLVARLSSLPQDLRLSRRSNAMFGSEPRPVAETNIAGA